jgi:penicillin-binding protein 1A
MDDKDLFSYANSNDVVDENKAEFDLNAFSSKNVMDESENSKKTLTKKQKILKNILVCFLVGVIVACSALGGVLLYVFTSVDGTMEQDLNDLMLNFTTTVYVDDGKGNYEEYTRLHGEFNRLWVDYDETLAKENNPEYKGIPQMLCNAFIAVEDMRFETHYGVDWKRTTGAVINEFIPIYSSRQGGSTITQQLVKNLTGDDEKSKMRKVREIMRAKYLESKYTKDVILECYLNTIAMGHGTYGVEVAANYYFDKSVDELTLTECAALAAITKSPRNYAPDTNPNNNKERRSTVLRLMKEQGYITEEEYEKAKNEELKVVANTDATANNDINSYFIDALITDVSEDLAAKYGYDKAAAERLFYSGGYKIYATVDTKMQAIAEKAYKDIASSAKKSSKGDPLWGAMTIMNYKGQVKALVGGIGEKTTNRGFNCAIDAIRQPGSTMKPMACYAPAIENNIINYSTILNDTKTTYGKWTPHNSYGGFAGNITAKIAVERSTNTIPVALVNEMGVGTSFNFLTQKLNIKNLTDEDKNLSALGLGGTHGGITTLESAAAYAIFGNGGLYYEPTFYTKVTNQKGEVVLEQNTQPTMAISSDTATIVNKMLQNVVYGKKGTATDMAGTFSRIRIYGKTGTSNDSNDKWFVGGSPYYVASSWIGYETMQKMPAANLGLAKRLWRQVMSEVHKNLPDKNFEVSKYAVKRYYCTETGLLATDACENIDIGWYKKGALPAKCDKHEGALLETPKVDVMPGDEETTSDTSSTTSNTSSNTSSGNSSTESTNSGTESTTSIDSTTQTTTE